HDVVPRAVRDVRVDAERADAEVAAHGPPVEGAADGRQRLDVVEGDSDVRSPGAHQAAAACCSGSPGSSGYQQGTLWPVGAGAGGGGGGGGGGWGGRRRAGPPPPPPIWRALGQRGWNGQPGGGLTGEGTSPCRMIRSRAASFP